MVELSSSVKVFEIDLRSGEKKRVEEKVAVEEPLFIYINGQHLITLISTPSLKKELALGHLVTEGLISSFEEVKKVQVKGSKVDIVLSKLDDVHKTSKILVPVVDTTSLVIRQDFLKALDGIREKFMSRKVKLDVSMMRDMLHKFEEGSRIYKETRGTHSAAIFKFNGEHVSQAEDVGRHNAVDKAIGDAFLRQTNFLESILFSSGRQPAYMVLKAARAHIPVIATIARPLESGVKVAQQLGLTLIRVSKEYVKVYTNMERLKVKKGFKCEPHVT